MKTTDDIRDLEKKYMNKIWDILCNPKFISDLKEMENYIQNNYFELDKNYQIKNKIQLGAERLLNFYIQKTLNVIDVYPSPISSDIAFFTEDALINVDAKTIDLSGNRGDDAYVQFGTHQISFKNKPLFPQNINGSNFKGMHLHPGLPVFEPKTGLPCLSFFAGITYKDDGNSFMISHIKLSCVPNGQIVEEEYNNNIILNYKTYRYLKDNAATKIGSDYVPKNTISQNWIPFRLNPRGRSSNNTWLDTTINDPFFKKINFVLWRFIAKKYHICIGGDTGRIRTHTIQNRKNSKGKTWEGIRRLDI